jgi:hypothetical protein
MPVTGGIGAGAWFLAKWGYGIGALIVVALISIPVVIIGNCF